MDTYPGHCEEDVVGVCGPQAVVLKVKRDDHCLNQQHNLLYMLHVSGPAVHCMSLWLVGLHVSRPACTDCMCLDQHVSRLACTDCMSLDQHVQPQADQNNQNNDGKYKVQRRLSQVDFCLPLKEAHELHSGSTDHFQGLTPPQVLAGATILGLTSPLNLLYSKNGFADFLFCSARSRDRREGSTCLGCGRIS